MMIQQNRSLAGLTQPLGRLTLIGWSVVIAVSAAAGSLGTANAAFAQAPGKIEPAAVSLGRPVDFEKDILPILESKCIACHNVAIAESRLNLEDVAGILKGGKRGPAVIAKEPDKSPMFTTAARSSDPQIPAMPPLPNKVSASAFTPQELGLLRQWIVEGASAGSGAGTSANLNWQPISEKLTAIYAVALSPWSRFAACGRANQIDLYDVMTGEALGRLTDPALAGLKLGDKPLYPRGAAHQDFVHALAFHPTEPLLASAGYREVKLWRRPDAVIRQSIKLETPTTALAVSADGKSIAVVHGDQQVRLLSASNGAVLHTLSGHTAPVTNVAFSADGSKLATVSKDKTVRLWNVADGQAAGVLETPAEIAAVAWNADGTRLYTAHGDQIARGWTVPFEAPKPAEGEKPAEPVKPAQQFAGHGGPVTDLVLVPGQPQLLTASADGNWRLWDLNNGNQVRSSQHGGPIAALAVRPDGQALATVGGPAVRLWNLTNGQPIADNRGDVLAARNVTQLTESEAVAKSRVANAEASFKAAEKNFKEREEATKKAQEARTAAEKAAADAEGKRKTAADAVAAAKAELAGKPDDEGLKNKVADAEQVLNKELEATKKTTEALEAAGKAVAQAEKGQSTAAEQQQQAKSAHEREIAAQKQAEEQLNAAKQALPATEKPFRGVAFTVEGRALVVAGEDHALRSFDAKTGKPLDVYQGHQAAATHVRAAADRLLVSRGDDNTVHVWDANPPWSLVGVLGPSPEAPTEVAPSPFANRVVSLAFSPDGTRLATGGGEPSRSGEVLLWEVATRKFLKAIPDAHSDTVQGLEFSRDGKLLISGAADKFVKIHDVETGKLVRSLEGHTHHVQGVTFKADGSRAASAGADNAIKVWNLETGEQQRTINNYSKQVTAIRFIGVSDNLISAGGDKTVKMHRANDGGNYRSFGGSNDFVYSVACARDESVVVAGGEDGVLRVWNGTNGQVLFTFDPPAPPPANTQARVP